MRTGACGVGAGARLTPGGAACTHPATAPAAHCGAGGGVHNAAMKKQCFAAAPGLGFLGPVFFGMTVLALLAPGSAAARPRDDVLSGAFRCAAIGDMRTWLDCYYGAAGPVRAVLGLKPVPAAQARLVAQPPSGTPPAADMVLRDQVMAGAVRCSGLPDVRQWLGCYYAAAGPARARLGLPGGTQAPPPPPLQPLGAPLPAAQAAPTPQAPLGNADQLSAHMASYVFDKLGWFTVTLDNGQVWRQVHGDTTKARWNKPAGAYLVKISHGFLGSYNFQVRGEPGLFKVRPSR